MTPCGDVSKGRGAGAAWSCSINAREHLHSHGKTRFCDSDPVPGVSASWRLPQPVLPRSGKSLSEVQVMGSAGTTDQRCRRKSH